VYVVVLMSVCVRDSSNRTNVGFVGCHVNGLVNCEQLERSEHNVARHKARNHVMCCGVC